MELLKKCNLIPSSFRDENVEVGLAQFAAIGGMSERDYAKRLFEMLGNRSLLALLRPNARRDLLEWLIEEKFGKKEFLIIFKLSLNRAKDVCLYCVCELSDALDVIFDEDGFPIPNIFVVKHAIPGLSDDLPDEGRGLEKFLLHFCDMEVTI